MKFMMSAKTHNQTYFAARILGALKKEFSDIVSSKNYGEGVKAVGIITEMRDGAIS